MDMKAIGDLQRSVFIELVQQIENSIEFQGKGQELKERLWKMILKILTGKA